MEELVKINFTLSGLDAKIYHRILQEIRDGRDAETISKMIFKMGLGRSLIKICEKLSKEGMNLEHIKPLLTLYEDLVNESQEKII